ncbi:UDP-N-acetylmuramoyl-L-alanyl-D-glutamate--2,6-diaminopimelate ligase [Candidatus Saccharibacteria bacterium]|nr:MAG: UDP-N-acetylmuramoyl-L-alanyl-D-glutamate--2,6-diaminopimelate ligase [Candidatus Saccharibacteria bacterium]
MKNTLAVGVRALLPKTAVRGVETAYRKTRARVAAARYGNPSRHLRVIAVTGTNGKTTTVSFLNEILKEAGYTTAMFSTATIEVAGTAVRNDLNATVASTARMQRFFRDAKRAQVDFLVMEFPSHAIHQHKLYGVPVEMAIMTNLTQDHLDYHGTMEAYAAVKGQLFAASPKYIVLNRDDAWFAYFDQYHALDQKITYGEYPESEAHIDRITLYRKGTEATVTIDHQTKLELATNLPGAFNAYNMTAAAAAAYLLGVNLKDIIEGVANLEAVAGRFERVVEGLPYDVIVDYAHTPDGLEKLLTAARAITKQRVILVFGACGDRDQGKRPIMGGIAARLADRIFLTDEESYNEDPQAIRDMVYKGIEDVKGGSAKTTEVADRRDAIAKTLAIAKKGDAVFITGMGHEVYRIVDGERIPWNDAAVVREILGKQPKS